MRSSFIVLSEVALGTSDAMTALTYLGLDPSSHQEDVAVRVVVPDTAGRPLVDVTIQELGLEDLAGRGPGPADTSGAAAPEAVLDASCTALRRVGCEVGGSRTTTDPVGAVRGLLDDCASQAVVVYTGTPLPDDAFAEDWAHRVEDHLSATVLHLHPASRGDGAP